MNCNASESHNLESIARSCNDNTDMAEVLAVITTGRERDINQNVIRLRNQLKKTKTKKDQQTSIPERKSLMSWIFSQMTKKNNNNKKNTVILMIWFF